MPTLLVIDDEPTIRLLIRLTFEPRGYEVLEAAEGSTGLELTEAHCPDIVLLDMALPEMNGLEVARQLPSSTPVLMLTGLAPELDLETAIPSIRGYVEKPFSPAALAFRVQEVLESEDMRPSQEAPAA